MGPQYKQNNFEGFFNSNRKIPGARPLSDSLIESTKIFVDTESGATITNVLDQNLIDIIRLAPAVETNENVNDSLENVDMIVDETQQNKVEVVAKNFDAEQIEQLDDQVDKRCHLCPKVEE